MGGGLGGCVIKVMGLRSTNWCLKNSHGDVKYSIANIVKSIVKSIVRSVLIIMNGVIWVLDLLGDHFVNYINA